MNTIAEFFKFPAVVQIVVLLMLSPAIWAGLLITFALMRDMMRHDERRTSSGERDAAVHSRMRKAS